MRHAITVLKCNNYLHSSTVIVLAIFYGDVVISLTVTVVGSLSPK